MIIAYIPVLVALLGLLLYALASNPKVQEVGRILFFCGALAECLALAGHVLRLG